MSGSSNKAQRLSVVGPAQDSPTVVRGVRWLDANRQVLIVIAPQSLVSAMAILTMRGPDAGKAVLYEPYRGASWPMNRADFASMAENTTVEAAVERMRKLADSQPRDVHNRVELRGRWTATWRLSPRGIPVVSLRRTVGQGVINIESNSEGGWHVQAQVGHSWKGGPFTSQPQNEGSLKMALVHGARHIREQLGKLHGESDRRQAHDEVYAAKHPIKRGKPTRDPLDRVKLPKASSSKRSKAKAASTAERTGATDHGPVVIRLKAPKDSPRSTDFFEVRKDAKGFLRVAGSVGGKVLSFGPLNERDGLDRLNKGIRSTLYDSHPIEVEHGWLCGLEFPKLIVESSARADRDAKASFHVVSKMADDRHFVEVARTWTLTGGMSEEVEMKGPVARRKVHAQSLMRKLVGVGKCLCNVRLNLRSYQVPEDTDATARRSETRAKTKSQSAKSRTRAKSPKPSQSRPDDTPSSTAKKDAQLAQLFLAGIKQALRA